MFCVQNYKIKVMVSNKCCDSFEYISIMNLQATAVSQEPTRIPEIKMEPKVTFVPVVSVCIFLIRCMQNCLPIFQCVLVKQNFDSKEWISSGF